jgi:hypothetical protein
MQDPELPGQSGWQKWKPHQSVVVGSTAGGGVGGSLAIMALPFILPHYPADYHDLVTVAFTTLCTAFCTFVASYLTPDKPRS